MCEKNAEMFNKTETLHNVLPMESCLRPRPADGLLNIKYLNETSHVANENA